MAKLEMTEASYHQLRNEDAGICPKCLSTENEGYYEPDRDGGTCEEDGCGGTNVTGMEDALVAGYISIIECEEP